MEHSRRTQLFLNVGHALDHLFMLIFPTVVLAMAPEFGLPYSEMLPLALELWGGSEIDSWLARLENAQEQGNCVFFRPDPVSETKGRCMIYALRPLICRLFGFFTVRNKYGNYVYGSCRVIKEKDPAMYEKAVGILAGMEHPSVYTDYFIRIIGVDSGFGGRMLPINHAALNAFRKIGYRLEHTMFVEQT